MTGLPLLLFRNGSHGLGQTCSRHRLAALACAKVAAIAPSPAWPMPNMQLWPHCHPHWLPAAASAADLAVALAGILLVVRGAFDASVAAVAYATALAATGL